MVRERLAFEASGEGEHLFLLIRKTSQNTRWIARELSRCCGIPERSVGYAGLKDRHAVTDQWFSVHLPGKPDPDPESLDIDGVECLKMVRHSGKLRIGALNGNTFTIVVRDLDGDLDGLPQRLEQISTGQVANYFGAQRFGRAAGNLDVFGDLAKPAKLDRTQRKFGFSALRSAMFNLYLARRLEAGTAAIPLPGEMIWNEQTHQYSQYSGDGAPAEGSVPSGLLWGEGENQSAGQSRADEDAFFAEFPLASNLLATRGVRMMRRPLLIRPRQFTWHLDEEQLILSFGLGRGEFATAVIAECVEVIAD